MFRGGSPASGIASFTGGAGVPIILQTGGIPLIGLSSGSVAAGGAISAITALPVAYPDAYCFFPANILAGAIAAGWYYCTFSTTTAGVAFLNTYTSGVPTIPTSPTAVTAGQGAFTGDTSEETAIQVTVPANVMGTNGGIRVSVTGSVTNNANAKTLKGKLGATTFYQQNMASGVNFPNIFSIINTGSASKQVSMVESLAIQVPTIGSALGTLNSAGALTFALSITRATATDNLVILPPRIEYLTAVGG